MSGSVVGLRSVVPSFAIYYLGFNAALLLAVYIPSYTPLTGSVFSPLAALFGAASLFGFCALAQLGWRSPQPLAPPPPVAQVDSPA